MLYLKLYLQTIVYNVDQNQIKINYFVGFVQQHRIYMYHADKSEVNLYIIYSVIKLHKLCMLVNANSKYSKYNCIDLSTWP